ncbi:hypothetical protein LCGC14_2435650, partial [marine sediment metagenome]
VGTDGITVLSGTPTASETTISGFRTEFLSASGTLVKKTGDTMTGDLLITNDAQITIPLGSASAPSIIFEGDPDTGIASQGSNAILFVTGGESPVVVTSSTLFLLPRILSNPGSAAAPQFSFLSNAESGMYSPVFDELAFTTGAIDALTIDANQIVDAPVGLTVSGIPVDIAGITTDHSALNNLDFASAGHTGFGSSADTDALAASGVATDANIVSVSGHLQGNIDAIDSSVTLQDAYDNGDGTISTTGGKPLELTGDGELTAVTGTFTDGLTVGTGTVTITPEGVTAATGTYTDTLDITGGRLIISSGTLSAPGLHFEGDPDTGIVSTIPDTFVIAASGTQILIIDTTNIFSAVPVKTLGAPDPANPDFSFLFGAGSGMYGLGFGGGLGFSTSSVEAMTIVKDTHIVDVKFGLTVSGVPVNTNGLNNLVEDLTPQLGGDLDVNGKSITSVGSTDIIIQPGLTGGIGLFTGKTEFNVADTSIWIVTSGGGDIALDTFSSNEGGIFIQAGTDGATLETFNAGK